MAYLCLGQYPISRGGRHGRTGTSLRRNHRRWDHRHRRDRAIFVWNLWIGLIVALVGLIGFGGFVRGKWY